MNEEENKKPKVKVKLKAQPSKPEPVEAPKPKVKVKLKAQPSKPEPKVLEPVEKKPKVKIKLKAQPSKPEPKVAEKKPTKPRTEQRRTIVDKFKRFTGYELKDLVKQSKGWFNSEVVKLASMKEFRVKGKAISRPMPGEMYMYHYDAKHKDTLPYWDKFPLVFPFSMLPDGFIGINFHYLHYKDRIVLLSALEEIAYSTRTDVSTKLKISYNILQSVAKNKKYEKCIHRYLYTHIKSSIKKIHSDQWITACLLPNENFTGATAQQVWRM